MSKLTIALDAMGGDYGPSVVVPAAVQMLNAKSGIKDIKLVLVGDEKAIQHELQALNQPVSSNLVIRHADEWIKMDEDPVSALKNGRNSSIWLALDLVEKNEADACVSAGNTGALMAIARYVLKMIPKISRPAIITQLPSQTGFTHVLDLGANVNCNVEHLMQFAVMGSVLAGALGDNKQAPKVGLLNVGEEDIKGNKLVKMAGELISEIDAINYVGFVEGNDIYNGSVDVVVCDGFVGNIALKASEGLIKMNYVYTRQAFMKNLWTKFVAFLAKPIFKDIISRLDPKNYNGASLIGLRKVVIKSHGSADIDAFKNAILVAIKQAEQNVPQLIQDKISKIMYLDRE